LNEIFACGSKVPDHLCFPFLRSASAKTENKKEESTALPKAESQAA
jgi:hypothetical protein